MGMISVGNRWNWLYVSAEATTSHQMRRDTTAESRKQAVPRALPGTRLKLIHPSTRQALKSIPPGSAIGHLLGHVENELAIFFVGLAEQSAKFVEEARVFAARAPHNVLTGLALGQVWQHRRFLAVIKELIEWAFESASHLLQCFNGRNCVAILDSGNVAPQKAGALFDIALGEFLFFAECAKAITDNHADIRSYS
jgi:hypothetical protein